MLNRIESMKGWGKGLLRACLIRPRSPCLANIVLLVEGNVELPETLLDRLPALGAWGYLCEIHPSDKIEQACGKSGQLISPTAQFNQLRSGILHFSRLRIQETAGRDVTTELEEGRVIDTRIPEQALPGCDAIGNQPGKIRIMG